MTKEISIERKDSLASKAFIDGIISSKEQSDFWADNGESGWPNSVCDFFDIYQKYVTMSGTDLQIWGDGDRSFADNIDNSKILEFVKELRDAGYVVNDNNLEPLFDFE